MGKLKTGLLYVSLHNQLKIKAGVTRCVSRKMFFEKLGRHFLIPKNLKIIVVKEMEALNLVRIEPNGEIRILDCDIDMENDVNELYRICGIY